MYKNNFIVAIKHEGRILREIHDEVSLPFGSQYSILLKNKSSRKALVDIEVDGENVLSGQSLIVDGYTSQEIKGFMRDMSVTNRFKFIHKTKEISDYRGDRLEDGLVTVSYRFEKEAVPIKISDGWKPYVADKQWSPPYRFHGEDYDWNTCCYDPAKVKLTSNPSVFDASLNSPEEGITVKGAKIQQCYDYGDVGELEYRTSTITIKLKGRTKYKKNITKPLVVKTKLRCPTCGRKSKPSAKFCYNCGTCLE